jgi:plasmid replication initiation protein
MQNTSVKLHMSHEAKLCAAGNEVVNAVYAMPLDCQRFILFALTKIEYLSKDLSREAFTVEISAQEWGKVFGGDGSGNSYKQLAKIVDRLQHSQAATVKIPLAQGYIRMQWADRAEYQSKKGYVRFVFGESIRKHLGDLRGDYTKMDLIKIRHFKSVYSVRVYMLLAQFRKTGVRIEQVDALREKLDLADKYKLFSALRRNVLDRAVSEIKEHAGIDVDYALQKNGSTVQAIKFTFPKS